MNSDRYYMYISKDLAWILWRQCFLNHSWLQEDIEAKVIDKCKEI